MSADKHTHAPCPQNTPSYPAEGYERELTRAERAAIRKLVTQKCANYDAVYQICLPLDWPCYMLNKCWTGALCKYFTNAVLPTEPSLERTLRGADCLRDCKACPVCGRAYRPTTNQAYCSDACRVAARRRAERERKRRRRQNKW